MKLRLIKLQLIIAFVFVTFLNVGCKEQTDTNTNQEKVESIFPKGELGPADHFTGKAWNIGLVADDTMYNTVIGNVYFEPGARSNWHSHPAGQILIITDGVGYYQEKGQPRRTIKKGDVVKCPPNVVHWHGASPDSSLQQLYIIPNTEKGIVQWMGPVSDEEYNNVK
jgi:quercetin dioxygenase-like cupin family protein